MSDSSDDLRRLQLIELGLMQNFARLCDIAGLRYYMLGGTLLGAVRHKGFIPWDDDVDLCMPRLDYEAFLSLAATDVNAMRILRGIESPDDSVQVTSIYSSSTYRQGMAKVTSSKMRVSMGAANEAQESDAWIDIIPMDGFPSNPAAVAAHKARLMFWKLMDATAQFDYAVNTARDRGPLKNACVACLGAASKVVRPFGDDYNKVLRKTDDALKRYDYDECDTVIELCAAVGFTEVFPKEWFGDGKMLAFEGLEFMAPAMPEKVLEKIYGPDYMTPLPPEKRDVHATTILSS